MDKNIKGYIEKQNSLEKELLKKARTLILNTIPECDEFFQWGVLCYCKGKIYLAAMKGRIHVGFSIIGLQKEDIKLFEGSGKTARHIKIYSEKDFDEKNIANLVKMINKKAGIPK